MGRGHGHKIEMACVVVLGARGVLLLQPLATREPGAARAPNQVQTKAKAMGFRSHMRFMGRGGLAELLARFSIAGGDSWEGPPSALFFSLQAGGKPPDPPPSAGLARVPG